MIIHKPKSGDFRVKRIFAIWPRKIDDRRDAFLQFVYSAENYLVTSWVRIGYFLTQKEADDVIKSKKEKLKEPKHWNR